MANISWRLSRTCNTFLRIRCFRFSPLPITVRQAHSGNDATESEDGISKRKQYKNVKRESTSITKVKGSSHEKDLKILRYGQSKGSQSKKKVDQPSSGIKTTAVKSTNSSSPTEAGKSDKNQISDKFGRTLKSAKGEKQGPFQSRKKIDIEKVCQENLAFIESVLNDRNMESKIPLDSLVKDEKSLSDIRGIKIPTNADIHRTSEELMAALQKRTEHGKSLSDVPVNDLHSEVDSPSNNIGTSAKTNVVPSKTPLEAKRLINRNQNFSQSVDKPPVIALGSQVEPYIFSTNVESLPHTPKALNNQVDGNVSVEKSKQITNVDLNVSGNIITSSSDRICSSKSVNITESKLIDNLKDTTDEFKIDSQLSSFNSTDKMEEQRDDAEIDPRLALFKPSKLKKKGKCSIPSSNKATKAPLKGTVAVLLEAISKLRKKEAHVDNEKDHTAEFIKPVSDDIELIANSEKKESTSDQTPTNNPVNSIFDVHKTKMLLEDTLNEEHISVDAISKMESFKNYTGVRGLCGRGAVMSLTKVTIKSENDLCPGELYHSSAECPYGEIWLDNSTSKGREFRNVRNKSGFRMKRKKMGLKDEKEIKAKTAPPTKNQEDQYCAPNEIVSTETEFEQYDNMYQSRNKKINKRTSIEHKEKVKAEYDEQFEIERSPIKQKQVKKRQKWNEMIQGSKIMGESDINRENCSGGTFDREDYLSNIQHSTEFSKSRGIPISENDLSPAKRYLDKAKRLHDKAKKRSMERKRRLRDGPQVDNRKSKKNAKSSLSKFFYDFIMGKDNNHRNLATFSISPYPISSSKNNHYKQSVALDQEKNMSNTSGSGQKSGNRRIKKTNIEENSIISSETDFKSENSSKGEVSKDDLSNVQHSSEAISSLDNPGGRDELEHAKRYMDKAKRLCDQAKQNSMERRRRLRDGPQVDKRKAKKSPNQKNFATFSVFRSPISSSKNNYYGQRMNLRQERNMSRKADSGKKSGVEKRHANKCTERIEDGSNFNPEDDLFNGQHSIEAPTSRDNPGSKENLEHAKRYIGIAKRLCDKAKKRSKERKQRLRDGPSRKGRKSPNKRDFVTFSVVRCPIQNSKSCYLHRRKIQKYISESKKLSSTSGNSDDVFISPDVSKQGLGANSIIKERMNQERSEKTSDFISSATSSNLNAKDKKPKLNPHD